MGSRRGSAVWGRGAEPDAPVVDVLLPTAGRRAELATTLAGLAAQDGPSFRVTISDQSDDGVAEHEPAVLAMLRVLGAQGRAARVLRHLPRRGLAEQRAFLLGQATADHVLFLDDDVWLEPGALHRMHDAITELGCGFVGQAVQGLSYLNDRRPHEQAPFERWHGGVLPERLRAGGPGTERWTLHNAANLTHVAAGEDLGDGWLPYHVAWIGGCVLYRTAALRATGGFDFWRDLPANVGGEDVAAQWRLMERFGGAGLLPSGAVHLEAPTTIPDRGIDAAKAVFA